MVGDRPDTDLAMARDEGWIAVLVLSGVTGEHDVIEPAHRPDITVPSIEHVVDVVAGER
jgi:ribonucleotide monophosphatase NagD (HAD superfamily)